MVKLAVGSALKVNRVRIIQRPLHVMRSIPGGPQTCRNGGIALEARLACRICGAEPSHPFGHSVLLRASSRHPMRQRSAGLIQETVLRHHLGGAHGPGWLSGRVLPAFQKTGSAVLIRRSHRHLARRTPVRGRWLQRLSAPGGHAAALRDGHVSHDADRLAARRARRAAAARNVRSGGTATPVPKYISSGVCPRNAE